MGIWPFKACLVWAIREKMKRKQNKTIHFHNFPCHWTQDLAFDLFYIKFWWFSLFFFCLFHYRISKNKLTAVLQHYKDNGITPRERKKVKRRPTSLSFEDVQRVVVYLHNYATAHAVMLPGRVPGHKRDDIVLLPSSDTKAGIHRVYKQIMESGGK